MSHHRGDTTSTEPVSDELTQADRNLLESHRRSSHTDDTYHPSSPTQATAPPPPPLYKFVFTGGPCGGKTTALARVFTYLTERGIRVVTCPEAFGILNSNGVSYDLFAIPGMGRVVQGSVLDVQRTLEDSMETILRAAGQQQQQPSVILCDRGLMDGAVYCSDDDFGKIVQDLGHTSVVPLRDERYDAVFHLVTAAHGAEAHYSLANNKVRTETMEEARRVDKATQRAWVGHAHFYVLDNATDFEGKLSRLVDIVANIVGLPSNLKRRSAKFLLQSRPEYSAFPEDMEYQVFEVEKVYLTAPTEATASTETAEGHPDDYSFIRRRSSVDRATGKVVGSVYQITTAKRTNTPTTSPDDTNHDDTNNKTSEWIEQKRIISDREYTALYATRDVERHVVRQTRISFLYEQQSFNVHMYQAPVSNVNILHAQVEAGAVPKLPPFLNVERLLERTEEDTKQYGAYSISLMR